MQNRRAFTLIELLVVIAIIALLMSILMPSLQRVRKQARTVVCQTNLRQWTLYFHMYTDEYNGSFQEGVGNGHTHHWFNALRSYYRNDHKMVCCPTALKPLYDESGIQIGPWHTFAAWGIFKGEGYAPEGDWGSYGINGWVENPPPQYPTVYENFDTKNDWRTPLVKGAGYIPLLFDAMRFNVFPLQTDQPPTAEDRAWEGIQHMRRACIDRHNGFINSAFLDWSVRKIGLKELWTLKWHRTYSTTNAWTSPGVQPGDWPDWMRKFKDY